MSVLRGLEKWQKENTCWVRVTATLGHGPRPYSSPMGTRNDTSISPSDMQTLCAPWTGYVVQCTLAGLSWFKVICVGIMNQHFGYFFCQSPSSRANLAHSAYRVSWVVIFHLGEV